MKTIVVGIGNPILGDDGVGIHIIRNLQKTHEYPDHICFEEAATGGMNLVDLIHGFDKAILIDAVSFDEKEKGLVELYCLDSFSTLHATNPHDVSFPEALSLAHQLGDKEIPKEICILGVNIKANPSEFSESLSPLIQKSVSTAVTMVDELLKNKMSKNT